MEAQVSRLPGKYSQFAWGGAGQYVAFHFESARKVIVFDLAADSPEALFAIPDVPPGDLLAASADKLVVVSPSQMLVRRWDLKTKKRDKLAIIEGNDPPQQALLGCAGSGPLLIVGRQQSRFFDLDSLKPMPVKGPNLPGTGRHGLSVQASPDGRTFGMIPAGIGPVGYASWHIAGENISKATFGGTSSAIRWAQPSGDGYLLMLPGGEIYNRNGRTIKADWLKGSTMIPTPDPQLILDVRLDQKLPDGRTLGKVTLCSTADCRPIDFEMGFEELLPPRIHSGHDVRGALKQGSQWRVQYVPALHRILTLPTSNDRIVLRPFDLKQRLETANRGFLYLKSIPPLSVTAGETLNYPIQVQTSGKRVRMSLEAGPENARIARRNRLTWSVPADYPEDWARFLLTIRTNDGQELLHSFEVAIEHPAHD